MITIFTPTFNRASYLRKLYYSLVKQELDNFEWLIVDDGSTDDTKKVVDSFMNEHKIEIRYYQQDNQGKHIAFNKGIELSKGDFFICVDSDDFLSDDALKVINDSISRMHSKSIGVVYPQSLHFEENKDKWAYIRKREIDIIDLKEKYGIVESAILIETKILKKYHFPQFEDDNGLREKFCPESMLYNKLIKEGKFSVYNSVIYISDYLTTGITHSLFDKIWANNFYGVIEDLNLRFRVAKKFGVVQRVETRIKAILNINALCFQKQKNLFAYTPSLIYSISLILPSILFWGIRFKKVGE